MVKSLLLLGSCFPTPSRVELSHVIQLLLFCSSKGTAFSEGKYSIKIHTHMSSFIAELLFPCIWKWLLFSSVTLFWGFLNIFTKNRFLSYLLGAHFSYTLIESSWLYYYCRIHEKRICGMLAPKKWVSWPPKQRVLVWLWQWNLRPTLLVFCLIFSFSQTNNTFTFAARHIYILKVWESIF